MLTLVGAPSPPGSGFPVNVHPDVAALPTAPAAAALPADASRSAAAFDSSAGLSSDAALSSSAAQSADAALFSDAALSEDAPSASASELTPEPAPTPLRVPVYGDPDFDDPWPSPRRQIAIAVRVISGLIIVILLGHRYLPNIMGVGSLIDTFLPWTFVPLIPTLLASLVTRSRWAMGVAVAACAVWGTDFGPTLLASGSSGPADLRILSQNVSSQNPDLTGISNLALTRNADIVVLQGMTATDIQAADHAAPAAYRYHLAMYEFSVWSKYPIDGSQPVDLATRSDISQTSVPSTASNSGLFGGLLRFTVQVTPAHTTTIFAVHLPQPNLSHQGFGVARDNALEALETAIKAESAPNLIVVGDLDLAQTDRGMGDLVSSDTGLVSAQAKAGSGFGFTWPASFPMVRLDDVLTRGLTPVRSVVLGAVGPSSAHRPIEADLRF